MTGDQVVEIFRESLIVAIKLGGPLLLISMVVGLVISIFQAATQVHEQTLSFVPKVLTIAILLLLMAPMMLTTMNDFVYSIFDIITNVSAQSTAIH